MLGQRALNRALLARNLEARAVVRTLLMRRTLHLVTADDCLALRPLHQEVLEKRMRATLGPRLRGVDYAELADLGRPLLTERPLTLPEAGRALGRRFPGAAARDLGDALGSLLPLVQVPPRGVGGRTGPARNTTIPARLGREPDEGVPRADDLILRYLATFGPAASADVRAWSGLGGLRAALQRLRPRLRSFRVLVDGRVAATWTVDRAGAAVTLRVTPLGALARPDRDAVAAEGEGLLRFLAPDDPARRVRFARAG